MSTLELRRTAYDSRVLVRRNLRRLQRYPSLTLSVVLQPLLFLLLFVSVLGETMGGGITGGDGGRADYLAYVLPGILVIGVTGAGLSVAISVASDMTEGVVSRLRTMGIARGAVLNGHLVSGVVQATVALVVVLGVALAFGFRATTSPVDWLAAALLLGALVVAVVWLCLGLGLQARSVETASNTPLLLTLLPLLGSGFVPVDSLPTGMAWFAEHQPFTPIIETLRALLTGAGVAGVGSDGLLAVAWCVAMAALGCWWALRRYEAEPRPVV
jgi:ABC-2 type transport system permease protein